MIVKGKPELGLQQHQQEAYTAITNAYKTKNKASVVIPTGCGKSFISLQLMIDNKDKNILFMAPTNAIKDQMYKYGKILDEQYSKLLLENTELSLVEVMLLDRVQKNIVITKEQSDYLRKNKLIEGRYPNIYVSKSISEIVNEKSTYIKNSGFDDQYYKDLVLQYLDKFKSITKEDLDNLLLNKLPDSLNEEQKKRKIKYLVNECLQNKEDIIQNIGTSRYPVWTKK